MRVNRSIELMLRLSPKPDKWPDSLVGGIRNRANTLDGCQLSGPCVTMELKSNTLGVVVNVAEGRGEAKSDA